MARHSVRVCGIGIGLVLVFGLVLWVRAQVEIENENTDAQPMLDAMQRNLVFMQQEITKLRNTVKTLEDDMAGVKVGAGEFHERVIPVHGAFDIIPDSNYTTNWVTNAVQKSLSIEFGTNQSQYLLYRFTNTTDNLSLTTLSGATNWGNSGGKYMALVRLYGEDGLFYLSYATLVSTDEKVAVDAAATPDYIGDAADNGVLHIGQVDATDGLDKTDGGNFVTMGHHDTSDLGAGSPVNDAGFDVIRTMTFDTYGHVLTHYSSALDINGAITNKIPDGTANYQILYWYNSAWNLLNIADTDYKVLQRKADDSLGYDYVRAHD